MYNVRNVCWLNRNFSVNKKVIRKFAWINWIYLYKKTHSETRIHDPRFQNRLTPLSQSIMSRVNRFTIQFNNQSINWVDTTSTSSSQEPWKTHGWITVGLWIPLQFVSNIMDIGYELFRAEKGKRKQVGPKLEFYFHNVIYSFIRSFWRLIQRLFKTLQLRGAVFMVIIDRNMSLIITWWRW